MTDEAPKQLITLVDLSGLFWRSWMSQGETLKARDRTLELVRRCMEGGGFQAPVALCLDRGRSFRKDLAATYKANRPEKDLQALDELRRTEAGLAAEGFTMWGADGFEADDVIATACRIAVERGHPVLVASADKDLLQLLDIPGVTVLRTHDFSRWGCPEVKAKYGVEAADLGDWLALVGDASDNIRGCPGVGEKTATKLLVEHGSLEAVITAAQGLPQDSPNPKSSAVARALVQCADDIRLGRRLVTLRFDAPIEFEEIYRPRERRRPANETPQEDLNMPNELSQGNELGEMPAAPAPAAAQPAEAAPPAPPAANPPAAAPVGEPKLPAPPAPTTAIAASKVVVPEVFASYELALEPGNAAQALGMAKILWRSGLYSRFPNEEACYAVITRGRELGVGALASLDLFHFFEGKLALHAHFIRHLASSDPDCEWFLPWPQEGDDPMKVARWATKHRRIEKPIVYSYTVEMAVAAGYCEMEPKPRDWTLDPKTGKPQTDRRGNWDKIRPQMLDKTSSTLLARQVYPGRAMGLYTLSELGGEES